tara:strand:+ start:131051 stop:132859 length:1809 start_codon:yes stop_codon:yes gene_type:complete
VRHFTIALFLVLTGISSALPAQEYLWPTNSGQYLSSTFGETRSAHFHAGLDIKTWGREGYEVYASRDGILYRLLVTERGYGNAIYLKHPDQTYTVYAHLQRFNHHFRSIADSIRLMDHSFEMDSILDKMGVRVKKGDVIGFTGSTGIGPPHLHFEIRDSLQNPINALTSNLEVQDDIPPVFSSLIVEPITKKSRVEGRPVSHFRRIQKNENSSDFGEIKVHGKAGLAVNVYDQANDVYNAYAVYSLGLKLGSDTLFYQELNTMSFDDGEQMFLDRIAPFGSTRRGHQRLYPKDGQKNPFYLIERPSAILQPKDSAETYTIFASDYFGNTSQATLTIVPDDTVNSEKAPLQFPTTTWYWTENWASPDLEGTIDLQSDIDGYAWKTNHTIVSKDSAASIHFNRIFPESHQKISTPDQRLSLRMPPESVFDTLTISTSYTFQKEEALLSIQPQMLPVRKTYSVAFFIGNKLESGLPYRLYQNDRDGDLDYVESELIGNTVHAWPTEFGEFVIKADTIAPVISDLKLYRTDYGEWRISVRATDDLSGIESSSAQFYVNGVRGIAEYDYETEIIEYYLPEFSPQSLNKVTLTLKDKTGNTAIFSGEL